MSSKLLPGAVIDKPGSSVDYLTGGWRHLRPIYENRTPPCNVGCPVGNDVQRILYLVKDGKFREAWEVLKETNPLPSVCGRICYHPCERVCNRRKFDEPLAIHEIERFLGDLGLREGWIKKSSSPPTGKKVAVVGSGPAGIACAYHLTLLGHRVTIFEALEVTGGMMAVGIAEERLPREILRRELSSILNLGMEIRTGHRIENLDELREYDAVFLAPGRMFGLPQLPQGVAVEHGRVKIDRWGRTGRKELFVGGDAAVGARRGVAWAIGSGRKAAIAIDKYLRDESLPQVLEPQPVKFEEINLDYFTFSPRVSIPEGSISEAVGRMVEIEAERCFSCGVCNGCNNCWFYCPDASIVKLGEIEYEVNYDYCKGCGICANECPRGVIRMVEEG